MSTDSFQDHVEQLKKKHEEEYEARRRGAALNIGVAVMNGFVAAVFIANYESPWAALFAATVSSGFAASGAYSGFAAAKSSREAAALGGALAQHDLLSPGGAEPGAISEEP